MSRVPTSCVAVNPKRDNARASASRSSPARRTSKEAAAIEFEELHRNIRKRELAAASRWESVTRPLLAARKSQLSSELKSNENSMKSELKKSSKLLKSRYDDTRKFLKKFYATNNPEKSETEMDALLEHYISGEFPNRFELLFNKLSEAYPIEGKSMVESFLLNRPIEDGLTALLDTIRRREERREHLTLRKEEVERELLFPSHASEGVGISPKWRARTGFEGLYVAIGDLTIEEASGGASLYVVIPSMEQTGVGGKRRPTIRLVVDGGENDNNRGLLTAVKLDNMVANGSSLPMSYSASHLNVETEMYVEFQAEHVDVKSPSKPFGFWRAVPNSFKCEIIKLRNRIKGATLPVPEVVLTSVTKVVLQFVLKQLILETLPPELGLYIKSMWRKERDTGGVDVGLTRRRASTSPDAWAPLDIRMSFKMSNKAPLDEDKSGSDLLKVCGLSEEEKEALDRASQLLGVSRKRLFGTSTKDNFKIHNNSSNQRLRNGSEWMRYYQKYLRDSLPREKSAIVDLWNAATVYKDSSGLGFSSSSDNWPGNFPFFERFVSKLEEIDRKPMRIETTMTRMDVKADLAGLIRIWAKIFVRLIHSSPAFEISSGGGVRTTEFMRELLEAGGSFSPPPNHHHTTTTVLNSMPPHKLTSLIERRAETLCDLIKIARRRLVDSLDCDMTAIAKNGRFSAVTKNSILSSPVAVDFLFNGDWLTSMMSSDENVNFPWRHRVDTDAEGIWWSMSRKANCLDSPPHLQMGVGALKGQLVLVNKSKNPIPENSSIPVCDFSFKRANSKSRHYRPFADAVSPNGLKMKTTLDYMEHRGSLDAAHLLLTDVANHYMRLADSDADERFVMDALLKQLKKANSPSLMLTADLSLTVRPRGDDDVFVHVRPRSADLPATTVRSDVSLMGLLEDLLEIFLRATAESYR